MTTEQDVNGHSTCSITCWPITISAQTWQTC